MSYTDIMVEGMRLRWEFNAKRVLGTAMLNADSIKSMMGIGITVDAMPPMPEYQLTWDAIVQMHKAGASINYATVWARVSDQVSRDFIDHAEGSADTIERAVGSGQECLRFAKRYNDMRMLKQAYSELREIETNHEDVVHNLYQKFGHSTSGEVIPSGPQDIAERANAAMQNAGGYSQIETQIKWLDDLLDGGIDRQSIIGIGGYQKGRKTTFLRNLIAGLLRDRGMNPREDVTIALLMFESNQEKVYWNFVAHIASELMLRDGKLDVSYAGTPYAMLLSGRKIRKSAYNGFKGAPPDLINYIKTARDVFANWNIQIYDKAPRTGNLRQLRDLERVSRYHNLMYRQPNQEYIFCIDHGTLVMNGSDNPYINMRDMCNSINDLVQEMDASCVVLTQYNEEYKKKKSSGEAIGDVLGVKGGNELEGIVTSFIEVEHDPAYSQLTATMRRSRDGNAGMGINKKWDIHKESGIFVSV